MLRCCRAVVKRVGAVHDHALGGECFQWTSEGAVDVFMKSCSAAMAFRIWWAVLF